LTVALAVVAFAKGDAGKGKAVYAANCAMCHGDAGKGDGSAGAALTPKPRNFTDKSIMSKKTDDDLFKAITKGVPNTSMLAYEKMLSEADRWDAVAYIKTLAK
ncbi:MAG: cytochrome c, partial [Nitrospirae bacterium]|nr:cytochrome c [Nitrospirota bacterium]